jgi:cadmium resistance transport/sequestration family protein
MKLIITSIAAFASTNIDDIFLLMLFFGNKSYTSKHVVLGQFTGMITLILASFVGSLASLFVDKAYIGLLGFLPLFLGIRGFITLLNKRNKIPELIVEKNSKANSIISIAAVTIANGGDNIGIYIPLFATLTLMGKVITISIFLIMTAVWCFIGKYLSKHPMVAKGIDRYGHIATPVVLIGLSIYILYESSAYLLIFKE